LNFADIFAIFGIYSATPPTPFTPGLEFSGTVIGIGKGKSRFRIGDRVMGATRFGGYSSHIVQKEEYLFLIPKKWSFEVGAAFPVQALTAFYALYPLGNCKTGDVVLIQSAAGGVGLLANQFAKRSGAITIGSVSSRDKIPILEENGYDHSIIRSKHFREEMHSILDGRALNLVLECVGGSVFRDCYELLSPMGRLITYGSANFTPSTTTINYLSTAFRYITRPKIDPLRMISDNKSVMGFNLIWLWNNIDILAGYMKEIMNTKPNPQKVGLVMQWNELHNALNIFRSGKTVGKVVINF
jgi:alcohol dehydrogenase